MNRRRFQPAVSGLESRQLMTVGPDGIDVFGLPIVGTPPLEDNTPPAADPRDGLIDPAATDGPGFGHGPDEWSGVGSGGSF